MKGVSHLSDLKKTVLCVLTGALTATSIMVAPFAGASAEKSASSVLAANAESAVPAPVAKGVQKLVRLLPELSSRKVVYGGDVDGPGVSGVKVSFVRAATGTAQGEDSAIFDRATGNLLQLDLVPAKMAKPAFPTDQQAKTRAQTFLTGLLAGNTYQAREVKKEEGKLTVRMVRKVNNVVFDDAYDSFVSFDAAGRLVGLRMFDGRLYETVNLAVLPSPQRVISAAQAVGKWKGQRPLELVYLLPEQEQNNQTAARLAYIVKDGVISQEHTGSALDAFSGKRLAAPVQQAQILNVTGTGEKWSAQTENEARNLLRMLFKLESANLPLAVLDEKYDDGQERRFFIWGYFPESVADADKKYHIGSFPVGISQAQKHHIMLETDAKTGRLIRFVYKQADEQWSTAKTDKSRDRKGAEALLRRLVPSGSNQLRLADVGTDKYTTLVADPLIGGVPVYRIGQMKEEGMYTITVNAWTGKVEEVIVQRPDNMVFPARAKAINEQGAMERLLQAMPLELTYIHQKDRQTGAMSWKLGYDLSFRQTRSHCFCGGDVKIDTTVYVDALTGQTVVKE
ncbi:hypothetical protein RI662_16170 [Brevibacillus agri]|uniref:hypothetical protein n=1 Tax=Brevibacillus agri TaxID=51101 RepID=UPI0028703149|nr:hypothetical protein [Brevibacillus agri]MDR9505825.1 hypothetical protein [Brevibacillus agri]